MNIGMQPMDMGEMHMAAQDMDHDMEAEQECETCDLESEDVAFSTITTEVQQTSHLLNTVMSPVAVVFDSYTINSPRPFLADTGPPPLSVSLVGTVILRV